MDIYLSTINRPIAKLNQKINLKSKLTFALIQTNHTKTHNVQLTIEYSVPRLLVPEKTGSPDLKPKSGDI